MIGKTLGKRYQLVEKIASGGMSNVFKALDLNLKRYDAVKILKDEYSDNPDFVNKFKQEANAVANLNHPNIVNIYNVGQEDGLNFIVMEYVKGKTLKTIIRDTGRLFESQAIKYSEQIARALEHAHSNNIVHRDVKPHNILITEDDRVKVLDFGIAKQSNSSTITNSGKIVGSVHYFSPEQARGMTTDRRSDIYSLGIVMYEMVTGRLPFDSESPVTIALKHMQEPIIAPKLINPQISEKMNQIILKATMKDPIDRYQSLDEMLLDIQKLKSNQNLSYANQVSYAGRDYGVKPNASSVNAYNGLKNDDLDYDFDDDFELEDNKEKKKNKFLLLLLLALLIVLTFVVYWLGKYVSNAFQSSKQEQILTAVKVPSIMGKTEEQAREILLKNGNLKLYVSENQVSDKPVGTVIAVQPIEGSMVNSGTTINVVLAAPKETVKVPDVSRKTEDEAKKMLTDSGFKVGNVNPTASDSIEKGFVIKTDPEQNTSLEKGAVVNLFVSSGKEVKITQVPNIVGKSVEEAKSILENAGLTIGIQTLKDIQDPTNDGKVLTQDVQPGVNTNQGSSVNIVVGRANNAITTPETKPNETKPTQTVPTEDPNKVVIPNIKGLTYADAKAQLEAVGLRISVLHEYGNKPRNEKVVIEYNYNRVNGVDIPVRKGTVVKVNISDPR